jgi:hypothetical protein
MEVASHSPSRKRIPSRCRDVLGIARSYNAFLGNVPLTQLFVNEYNHLTFSLPANVKTAFQSSATCKFDVVLNTSNGAGRFLLDRMGFE